ncbi:hypothetical protein NDU88_001598 [Pleurodeles waltl]|uniref:Uncharacterized protein n=1 Tax=Pleurodeles waltl TaxID=8319 RepID=A0AAV7SBC5_PLEWA|nr:hypothetical protein NDU88_001598 [Pleurodeles waltl]
MSRSSGDLCSTTDPNQMPMARNGILHRVAGPPEADAIFRSGPERAKEDAIRVYKLVKQQGLLVDQEKSHMVALQFVEGLLNTTEGRIFF